MKSSLAPVLVGLAAGILAIGVVTMGNSQGGAPYLDGDSLLILVSLLVLAIGTYMIWPSRWNVPAHLQLGFALTSYVIPIVGLGVVQTYPKSVGHAYAVIIALGSVAYLVGLMLGHSLPRFSKKNATWAKFVSLPPKVIHQHIAQRTLLLLGLALVGMFVSFAFMGFIPVLAENPLEAKFFRGPYYEAYVPVAPLFRTSFQFLVTLIPVALAVWYSLRSKLFLGAAALSVAVLAATLTRAQTLSGILLFLGLVLAMRSGRFFVYLLFLALVYPLGAAIYFLANEIVNLAGVTGQIQEGTWQVIAGGTPDVREQLLALTSFMGHGEFTMGKTFWGGLIPWHFPWNPAVWVLDLVNPGAHINDIISGGFRLPPPLWGYFAFGYAGAIGVPFLSGVILGKATQLVKPFVSGRSILVSMVALTLYTTLGAQLAGFYFLSITSLPAVAAAILLLKPLGSLSTDERPSGSLEPKGRTMREPVPSG